MSKIITLDNISTLWNNIKEYIRTYVSVYVDSELEQEPKLSMLKTEYVNSVRITLVIGYK